jgi:hypothetical protein
VSRRRRLVWAAILLALVAATGGGAWEYHRLDSLRPLVFQGGEGGGDFYRFGITPYTIPDEAFGPYAGRDVEVMPVGSGPGWLGFSIYNSGGHAVTITGLAGPVASDPAGHLRIVALLSPAGYQGDPDAGDPSVRPPVAFRPTTVPAHAYRWIGARFATTSCAGITGSRRFVIAELPLRIEYLHVFSGTDVVAPPWLAVATCGRFHPVLDP